MYKVYEEAASAHGWIASFKYKKEAEDYIGDKEGLTIEKEIEVEPESHAINNVKNTLDALIRNSGCEDSVLYLTGQGNYREGVATIQKYKGNRDDVDRPAHYDAIKRFLIEQRGAQVLEGIEADDQLSMDQWEVWEDKSTMICSIDKDLKNTPGYHYNFVTNTKVWVSEVEAATNFCMQMLSGDPVDNIPGLYKITEKKATKKLKDQLLVHDNLQDMWKAVESIYRDCWPCGKDHDTLKATLYEIGRLLWMSRDKPDDLLDFVQ